MFSESRNVYITLSIQVAFYKIKTLPFAKQVNPTVKDGLNLNGYSVGQPAWSWHILL